MATLNAIRAIRAIETINKLMDLYDAYEDDEPKLKKRKIYVKSEDVESQVLKDIAWKNIKNEDSFCPMNMENFKELFTMLASEINNNDLVNSNISLRMRLAITLRYLIGGDLQRSLEAVSHIPRKYIAQIIPQMLRLLIDILEKEYLKLPQTKNEWLVISSDFNKLRQFPHLLGVLDGKHFRTKCPHEISDFSSLILFSILDAHNRFVHVEIIDSAKTEPSNFYINSSLYKALKLQTLKIPTEQPLRGQHNKTPYYFVGSDIFGMDRYTIKTLNPKINPNKFHKIFNYRINRVNKLAEMAFEILFHRFKIFNRLNCVDVDTAKLVIKACCILHNYFTQKSLKSLNHEEDDVPHSQPNTMIPLPKQKYEAYDYASQTRDNVCNYCGNEGDIEEQAEAIIKKEY